MSYNNYHNNYGRGGNNYRSNRGGQTYVWRVTWWNINVRHGAYQHRSFRSKVDAMIFRDKLKSNPHNNVWDVKKIDY